VFLILVNLSLSFLLGVALGFLHFSGLWITVNYLPKAKRPVLAVLLSFVFRIAMVLVAFYFIMGERWERLGACVLGFILARSILVYFLNPLRKGKGKI